jgi:hypothetical protein
MEILGLAKRHWKLKEEITTASPVHAVMRLRYCTALVTLETCMLRTFLWAAMHAVVFSVDINLIL